MDSLRIFTRVFLDVILSVDETLWNLGTLEFVPLHLLSAVVRHFSAVADLICLIESLEET